LCSTPPPTALYTLSLHDALPISIRHPAQMPLYAGMAMLGSVFGCVLLFYIAEKGGEALFHKNAGDRAPAIRNWVVKNGFGGMLIDRKSTRLNSSHVAISYAVFCL